MRYTGANISFCYSCSPYWKETSNYWQKRKLLKVLLLNVMKRSVQQCLRGAVIKVLSGIMVSHGK